MIQMPKPMRKILSPKEYHELRVELYNEHKECCPRCHLWRELEQMHIHHIERGAKRSDDKIEFLCWECHRRLHDGN